MTEATPVRVLLVEDHVLIRDGLRTMLERRGQISVVGEAASGEEGLATAARTRPDVVLMDVTMPGMNGLEATARLAKGRPPCKVIVLSGSARPKFVQRALLAGAKGYVLKTESPANLATAILEVHAGGRWFSPTVRQTLAELALDPGSMEFDPLDRLSPRQRSVLQLIAEGASNREIGTHLGISESTVDTHRTELMRRLGLHDVAGLVRFACQEGIVGVD